MINFTPQTFGITLVTQNMNPPPSSKLVQLNGETLFQYQHRLNLSKQIRFSPSPPCNLIPNTLITHM